MSLTAPETLDTLRRSIILWCGDFNYRVDMENDQASVWVLFFKFGQSKSDD